MFKREQRGGVARPADGCLWQGARGRRPRGAHGDSCENRYDEYRYEGRYDEDRYDEDRYDEDR